METSANVQWLVEQVGFYFICLFLGVGGGLLLLQRIPPPAHPACGWAAAAGFPAPPAVAAAAATAPGPRTRGPGERERANRAKGLPVGSGVLGRGWGGGDASPKTVWSLVFP